MNMDLDAATKEAPTLTLDPFAEAKAEIVEKKPEELVEEQAVPEMELTPEEQKMVDDFAGQIDLTNTQAVLQYGAGSQKKIADFSETALSNVLPLHWIPLRRQRQRSWRRSRRNG